MRRRVLLSSIAVVPITGCTSDGDGQSDEPGDDGSEGEPEDPQEGERVEIVESELVRENVGTTEERVAVHGIARVKEGAEVSYVEIRALFYDAEGELLDTIIEQIDEVGRHGDDPEGRRWEFEIVYPQVGERAAEVESYELEVGTEL
ncbi:FxLYD domain-containing protein [Halalkalicoccus salilacus]|uniref:FxLYD domain-containing protein n=1 Tax=Halalkalicoccus salilacus TaxID=3117459 RepID=UPI00300EE4B8